LPLNCGPISYLILLTEREKEIESFGLDSSEHYTQEKFLDELSKLGLESDAGIKKALQEMNQKGFTHADNDGRFYPNKKTKPRNPRRKIIRRGVIKRQG
jgi:hypothetical protein